MVYVNITINVHRFILSRRLSLSGAVFVVIVFYFQLGSGTLYIDCIIVGSGSLSLPIRETLISSPKL